MSVPLSDTRLTEIRERKAAATGGGRWILLAGRTVDEYRVKAVIGEDEVVVGVLDFGAGPAARDDKSFVVNAGRDVTALLAEVDRLSTALERMTRERDLLDVSIRSARRTTDRLRQERADTAQPKLLAEIEQLRAELAELKKTPRERANDRVRALIAAGDHEGACAAAEAFELSEAHAATHPQT